MKIRFGLLLGIYAILFHTSCRKLVEVSAPITSTNQTNVYTSDGSSISVLTGIYTKMSSGSFSGVGSITSMSLLGGLSGDELSLYNGATSAQYSAYYTNSLTSTTYGSELWTNCYSIIYDANAAIEGLSGATALTPSIKQQLMGEAEFVRAFYYFYLVNLYGDVPLPLTAEYKTNSLLPRTPQDQVWAQIISDLKSAQNLLSGNYLDATLLNTTTQRLRPTSWAATALLARSYLYTKKWDSAELEATAVINNGSLFSLDTLNGVFLANSTEAIWQLQPVLFGENTQDAILFVLPTTGPSIQSNPVFLDTLLVNVFEPLDQRSTHWIGSVQANGMNYYYPNKYKVALSGQPVTEYTMVFRLAEQYLIRAEAEAELNDLTDAGTDLDTIRFRAGLPNTSATTQTDLLTAILHERQVELFTEWGQRWLDLKRTQMVNTVMGSPGNACAAKGGTWSTNWQLYPLPLADLQSDRYLVQNAGY